MRTTAAPGSRVIQRADPRDHHHGAQQVRCIRPVERERLEAQCPDAIFISAPTGDGVDALLTNIEAALPESPFLYPDDDIAPQSVRFFTSELVRETALEQLNQEVSASIACEIEEFREDREPIYIRAVIYVERDSQKRILIGDRPGAGSSKSWDGLRYGAREARHTRASGDVPLAQIWTPMGMSAIQSVHGGRFVSLVDDGFTPSLAAVPRLPSPSLVCRRNRNPAAPNREFENTGPTTRTVLLHPAAAPRATFRTCKSTIVEAPTLSGFLQVRVPPVRPGQPCNSPGHATPSGVSKVQAEALLAPAVSAFISADDVSPPPTVGAASKAALTVDGPATIRAVGTRVAIGRGEGRLKVTPREGMKSRRGGLRTLVGSGCKQHS